MTYYGAMLDALREALGPDCVIYVQSIPPVRPEAAAERPGLTSDNLRRVNEQLAQLADSKGCVYLDLWEALADGEGNLKAVCAAPDGVHLSAGNGYGAWVNYLRSHTLYAAGSPGRPAAPLRNKQEQEGMGSKKQETEVFCKRQTPERPQIRPDR